MSHIPSTKKLAKLQGIAIVTLEEIDSSQS